MENTRPTTSRWRKLFRFLLIAVCALLVLTAAAIYALTLPAVQQKITDKAESFLQEKLGTRVEIGAVRLRFPYYLSLEKFLMEDQQGDTLARVGSLVISMDMWKLLDQTIELQKITLEDAGVYLHRKDSIYNFDFAVKAFANPDTMAVTPVDTAASPWNLRLDLAVISLKSVDFLLQDEDSESTTQAKIGNFETTIEKADLQSMNFELDGFTLADSEIRMIQKKKSVPDEEPSPAFALLLKGGDISRSHLVFSTTELALDANLDRTRLDNLQVNSANDIMGIQAKGIRVENSTVAYRDPLNPMTPGHFNASDMALTGVNADLPNFSFQNDTIFVQANALSGNDKSGLQLHSLSTRARVTPGSIEIQNLLASLNNTSVEGNVVLYKNDKATFDRMSIQLQRVKGLIGDLIVLLPPQENPALARLADMPYEVSGNLNGWLDNLRVDKMELRAGSGTVAFVTGSVQQLTEPTKMGMNLNISRLETNRSDLVRWMSVGTTPKDSILAQPLPAYVSASGIVNGTLSRLQLSLRGEVGALQTGPSFPAVSGPPLQFDLGGSLTNAGDPDRLGMDITIHRLDAPQNFFAFLEAKGLHLPEMLQTTGTLRGTMAALNTDLTFNALRGGTTSTVAFKGLLQNLNVPDQLGFDVVFDANLSRRELLGYIPDSLVNGKVNLPAFVLVNGQAKGSVNNATGKINLGLGEWGKIFIDGSLRDSTYEMDLAVQNLRANQLLADTSLRPLKMIGLVAHVSGEGFQFGQTAKMQLAGKFDSIIWDNLVLRDLTLDANVEGKKFAGGFQSPDERAAVKVRATGDFSTNIPLLDADITINCMDLREFGWSSRPTTVCMHIISHSEGLSVDTLLAQMKIERIDLQYDTVHIRPGDLTLDLKLDNRHNSINIASDWLQGEIKGYFALADLSQTFSNVFEQYFVVDRTGYVQPVSNDSLSIQLRLLRPDVLTTGLVPGLTELGPVNIDGSLIGQRNYFNLIVQAPRIVYQAWDIDSLNVRAFAGDTAALFALTTPLVKRGNEDFIQNAVLRGRFAGNAADVTFKASNTEGRERFVLALRAALNGANEETLVTLNARQVIDFKEWNVDPENKIRITPAGVEIRHFTMTGDGQSIKVDGMTRNLAANKTGLDLAVDIDRINYNNFDIFVAQVLRELGGWAEAHLKIGGTTDALQVRGKVQLHETFFTPAMTNVRYQLSETPIEFTESGVNLDGLSLRDPYGKSLEISGKLATTDWKNITTNLRLHADRWQVMNSTKQQNPVYYGEVYVSIDGTVRGPVTQPDVQVVIKTAKESNFTYVYDAATQTLQHEGVVVFVAPPRQYVRPPIYDAPVNAQAFTLSASIEIDSNLTVNSVINPVTGDDFRGKATGKLQLDILSNGNMTLAGRVELVQGIYNYSYQSVVKRSFEVVPGSTVSWTGDVRTPELDLKARYQFKASPFPLVVNQLSSASTEEAAAYRKSQTFYLQTAVSGSTTQPTIAFEFTYPPTNQQGALDSGFGNQQEGLVESALSNINQDKNQLSKQVFGVLLLRNFVGETGGLSTSTSGGNALEAGLSSFLTGQLNALADQYLTFIDIDLSTTEGATNNGASSAEGTTNYQLRLQKSFFEDRLTFKISGGTTVGGNGDDAHSALENASVEYALTPSGEFKVTVFSERGVELLNSSSSNLRNSGAGFILTKEFGGK